MKTLSIGKIVAKIAIIIAVVDLLIMLVLGNIPHDMDGGKMQYSYIALLSSLNALLLVSLASPLIFFWVVKPFVKQRDSALAKVTLLAHYDPLTDLANRRLIDHNLKILIAHCARRKIYSAFLLIDLDDFKTINDTYGHDAGDAVLIETAKHLKSSLRDEDVVGRLGGDEFVVLIDHLDENEEKAKQKIVKIAEKLNNAIKIPFIYNGKKLVVGSSIGISFLHTQQVTVDTVYKRADIAMYQAKKSAQKNVIFSDENQS